MKTPLVSIIIPTYNYGHLIADALISVANQTYTNWECIIIDDGSTDNTKAVVADFISRSAVKQFRYISVSNGGTSAAKNMGIMASSGAYIQFLDADDIISPQKLAVQVRLINESNCALVFSRSLFFILNNGYKTYNDKYPVGYLATESLSGEILLQRLVKNNIVTIGSPLVNKELVLKAGMFNRELNSNEDWLFWFRIAMLKPVFIYDDNESSAVEIRLHEVSAMTNNHLMRLGEVVVREEMEKALSQYGDSHFAELMNLNADLLALHEVRSLSMGKGMRYILFKFVRNPVRESSLMIRGVFNLAVRFYRVIVR